MAITDTPPWMKRKLALSDPAHPGHSAHVISSQGRSAERIWNPSPVMDEGCRNLLISGCQAHRNEMCGFVTRLWTVHPVLNSHLEPRHNYYFDPDDTERVLKEIYEEYQTEIIGQYHSHPNDVPWPSPRDLVGWPNPALGWRYWIVTNSEVIEWRLTRDQS